jgi:hypothetical protein
VQNRVMRKTFDLNLDLPEFASYLDEISAKNKVTPFTPGERAAMMNEFLEAQRWAKNLPQRASDAQRAARQILQEGGSLEDAERAAHVIYPNGRWNKKAMRVLPELLS